VIEDNMAYIEWSNHVIGGRERAKHMDIRKHFSYEAVQNGHMRLFKILIEHQPADMLTKGPRPQPLPVREVPLLLAREESPAAVGPG
jgi:hypothetical protein